MYSYIATVLDNSLLAYSMSKNLYNIKMKGGVGEEAQSGGLNFCPNHKQTVSIGVVSASHNYVCDLKFGKQSSYYI